MDRLHELATRPKPTPGDRDDARLAHLVSMFAQLNSRGIAGNIEPDQAHDPVNKDTALKQRYAKMRADSNTTP